jgi:alpha-L-fucosidase
MIEWVKMFRKPLAGSRFLVTASLFMFLTPASMSAATTYQATAASVNTHDPAPEWYKDAKFGIYFHWGVYSVPAYGNEWYPRLMYCNASDNGGTADPCYSHHIATYGNLYAGNTPYFPYDSFITGGHDLEGNFVQFAPRLTDSGGNFNPDSFAALIANSGAWFAGPVAEHHDGFSMWNSACNEWNAVKKGPKIDCYGLLVNAFRKKNLKVVASFHTAYHIGGYYQYVPQANYEGNPHLTLLYAHTDTETTLWYDKIVEVINQYFPDIITHDFDVSEAVDQTHVDQSLAYYYNRAIDSNKEVVVTFKDGNPGMDTGGEVFDFERNMPDTILSKYWQSDDCISGSSWCYTTGMSFYSLQAIFDCFIDRVSKNGNLLLNFGPEWDGTIPTTVKTYLTSIGSWLGMFGESIYCTRAWDRFGEPGTRWGNGTIDVHAGDVTPTAGLATDVRYTRSKDSTNGYPTNLFAIFMGWPGNGAKVTLTLVTATRYPLGSAAKVYFYGTTPNNYTSLAFSQSNTGLQVTFPSTQPYTTAVAAYALKISQTGQPPQAPPPKPWLSPIAVLNRNMPVQSSNYAANSFRLLCIGTTPSPITIPKNATGLAVYSLQGRKVFEHAFTAGQSVYWFEDFKRFQSEMLCIKFTTK